MPAALVRDMRLGQGSGPDLLSVGLSATDYIGHDFGTEGQEMCLNMVELDREIGDFLAYLDSTGVDYAVALTADHGGEDLPERLRLHGVADAQRVDPSLNPSSVGKAIAAKLGLSGPVLTRRCHRRYLPRPGLSRPPIGSVRSTKRCASTGRARRSRQCSRRTRSPELRFQRRARTNGR